MSQVRILSGALHKRLYRAKSGQDREGTAPPDGNGSEHESAPSLGDEIETDHQATIV
jgi:hypothetical protein